METILDRVQEIAIKEGISIGAIERNIGASKGVLSRAIKNKTDIQAKWLQIIVENYPQYSAEWLLTGNGNAFKNPIPVAHHTDNPTEGIPLIPLSAMAGALKGDHTVLEYECERYIVPVFREANFLIPVKGSSMSPTFNSGDIIACMRVPMTDLFFQWNKVYVVDTVQGIIFKRIKPGSDKEHVLIVSDNEDYDPFELPYSAIYSVALVIGTIRLE